MLRDPFMLMTIGLIFIFIVALIMSLGFLIRLAWKLVFIIALAVLIFAIASLFVRWPSEENKAPSPSLQRFYNLSQ